MIESSAVFQRRAAGRGLGVLGAGVMKRLTVSPEGSRISLTCRSCYHADDPAGLLARRRDALIMLSELCQKLRRDLRWEVVGAEAAAGGASAEQAPSAASAPPQTVRARPAALTCRGSSHTLRSAEMKTTAHPGWSP